MCQTQPLSRFGFEYLTDNLFFDSLLLSKILNPISPSAWKGTGINLSVNGEIKQTIPESFTEFEYCLPLHYTDEEINLQSTSTDGVCITKLTVNGNQIFVGKFQNQPYFWIDGDHNECSDENMSTPYIKLQNGQITSSFCKGLKNV